jgi:hypothetical protein
MTSIPNDKLTVNRLNFLWPDQAQRLVSLPAPTYIDFVMSWLQKLLDEEGVFPTKSGMLSVAVICMGWQE